MKFFDIVLLVLFMVGCFVGSIWAKTYLIPTFFPSLVVGVLAVPSISATAAENPTPALANQAQGAIESVAEAVA